MLAGFAWLTHHPETPWLARAEAWPVVGPAAAAFRTRYLGPEPPAATAEEDEGPEVVVVWRGVPHSGPFAGLDGEPGPEAIRGTGETLWLEPGMTLREGPARAAPGLLEMALIANVPVLERRGEWARVAYRRQAGWVHAPRRAGPPPLGSAPAPPLPVPALPPDEARLARARELLGADAASGRLGPYPLYTDLADEALLAFLDRVASDIEAVYRQRYGRVPLGEPAEAVVLFASERDYLTLKEEDASLRGLRATGYAGHGLVALYAEGLAGWELAGTLAHELTHLLNRRALGPALPPWLDEGLAGDLGAARFTPAGLVEASALGGETLRSPGRLDFAGARASLRRLAEALDGGRLPPLGEVLARPWEEFVAPPASELNYAASAFFVRYLLSGEGGRLAPRFHAFLAAVSRGEPSTAEALAKHLDHPLPLVELRFRAWLVFADAEMRLVAGGI